MGSSGSQTRAIFFLIYRAKLCVKLGVFFFSSFTVLGMGSSGIQVVFVGRSNGFE